MKTHPILRADVSMLAFEVSSAWLSFRPLFKIIRSVEGVTDVRRRFFNENRLTFIFYGVPFVVNEPWGDSSRYWIGPENPEISSIDASRINQAFSNYKGPLALLWSAVQHKRTGA
jgi:hypothetical protein